MKGLRLILALLVAHSASADICQLDIRATDQMRFEQQELAVTSQCTEVEVTLHNTGKLPASIMGHDWVLTRTADVASVASAGMNAGLVNNYQKPGDLRIIASTRIVGGGESATVRFPVTQLKANENYSYFCSAPGHFGIMKGKLVYNAVASPTVAQNILAH